MGKRGKRKKLKEKHQNNNKTNFEKINKHTDEKEENKSSYMAYIFIFLIILILLKLLMVFDIFLSKPFTALLHNSINTNYYIAVTNSIIEILFTIVIILIIANGKHFLLTAIAIILSVAIFYGHDFRYLYDFQNVSNNNYSVMKLAKNDFYMLQNKKSTGTDAYYIQLANKNVLHMNSNQYYKIKNLPSDCEIEVTYLKDSKLLLDYTLISED